MVVACRKTIRCPECEQTREVSVTKRQFDRAKRKWADGRELYADQPDVEPLDRFLRHQSLTETWNHPCPAAGEDRAITREWSYRELEEFFG